MRTGQPTQL